MCVQGQNLPYIGATTIMPQFPVAGDAVKIITYVTTPNQGGRLSKDHSVTLNPNEIHLRGCYWSGMLTAIHNHTDTFDLGQLSPGVYTIKHKAYLSSDPHTCNYSDSNMVLSTFTVAAPTGLNELSKDKSVFMYPNPVKDVLYFTTMSMYTDASLYAMDGRLLKTWKLESLSELVVSDLTPGMYFIRFSNNQHYETLRFIK